jgi:chorismate dehydratase
MWDFEHPPLNAPLAQRYQIDRMSPSECADRLASGEADIGLVPIAALAANPGLRILPGCTIASKGRVRSLLLVRRASQPLAALRSVAADTASRTTLAYARILFHKWGNPDVPFLPASADLDAMLDRADAAILIGDPALLALEERANRFERTGEELVYHDLAWEWKPSPASLRLRRLGRLRGISGCPRSPFETWDPSIATTSSNPATTA